MPQDPAAVLSSLLRASSIDDHDEILRAANAALKANKNDVATQHTRVVALLKLDRFEDALRAIDEGGNKLSHVCALENAYALYKAGKLDEATAALQSVGLEKRGFNHVAAQIAYRAEKFDEARTIYSRLLSSDVGDEENDLNINLRAACAQAEWQGFSPADLPSQDTDSFEMCYNSACAYIARGSFDVAAELLERAVELCRTSDDLTDEDKEAELKPIIAQQTFVLASLGKLEESVELYKSLHATSYVSAHEWQHK